MRQFDYKIYTDNDSKTIPKSQGIYAFYIDVISPLGVGLIGNGPFAHEDILKAKKRIIEKTRKVLKFMKNTKLEGTIVNSNKRSGLAESYLISAQEIIISEFFNKINSIGDEQVIDFIKLMQNISLFCQPIYVGITKKQTLYERYYQHMSDYENAIEKNRFGTRLNKAGFDWDEVIFTCIEFPISNTNDECLDIVEDYLLTVSKPLLSQN